MVSTLEIDHENQIQSHEGDSQRQDELTERLRTALVLVNYSG